MTKMTQWMCVGALLCAAPAARAQEFLGGQIAPAHVEGTHAPAWIEKATGGDQLGAQIFFRFGAGFASQTRARQPYTDVNGLNGENDGESGFAMGFGFNLPLVKDIAGGTLLGEVLIDYAEFSNNRVVPVTSAILNNVYLDEVRINQLAIVGAPKYRYEGLGDFRPWVVPVGMAFFVNSPPSRNSSYIDAGLHFGTGADYRLTESVSLGLDCRYNYNLTRSGPGWLTTGAYVGFDF